MKQSTTYKKAVKVLAESVTGPHFTTFEASLILARLFETDKESAFLDIIQARKEANAPAPHED